MTPGAIRQALDYARALTILDRWLGRLTIPVALLPSLDALLSGIQWHWWALVSATVLLFALRAFIGGRVDQIHATVDDAMQAPEWRSSAAPRDSETFAQYVARMRGTDAE